MHNPRLKTANLSLEEHRSQVRRLLAPHRLELMRASEGWIRRTEGRIASHLIHGAEVEVESIDPELEIVETDKQNEVWRYCRFMGAIPYNGGCGRRIRFLLRDAGQPKRPVMGIIALSSPVVICRPRDQWIGWKYPRDVDIKKRRLLACMDLSVSMAVPPYNHLTAGKMICLAATSNEVRQAYHDRYSTSVTPTGLCEGRLALITTTSLYGSSVQYNRLRVDDRKLFSCVGYTSGFGNAHVTEAEFAAMEQYLRDINKPAPKGWGTGRSYRLRVLTAYQRNKRKEAGISGEDTGHEHQRSVYVAPLASNSGGFLREETDILDPFNLPFAALVERWRDRWLTKRLGNEAVVTRFRATDPTDFYLSRELTEPNDVEGPDEDV